MSVEEATRLNRAIEMLMAFVDALAPAEASDE
jgi:hypothetical protein